MFSATVQSENTSFQEVVINTVGSLDSTSHIDFYDLIKSCEDKGFSKFIFELESLLADKNVTLNLTPKARLWLAENGYDAKMGARPMARLIQESIKKPLANDLLFGAVNAVVGTVPKGYRWRSHRSTANKKWAG